MCSYTIFVFFLTYFNLCKALGSSSSLELTQMCSFLCQSEKQVTQSCPALCNYKWTVALQAPPSMGFFQARILEWVAISSSRGSSWSRDWTQVSHIAGRLFTIWATKESPFYAQQSLNHLDRGVEPEASGWRSGLDLDAEPACKVVRVCAEAAWFFQTLRTDLCKRPSWRREITHLWSPREQQLSPPGLQRPHLPGHQHCSEQNRADDQQQSRWQWEAGWEKTKQSKRRLTRQPWLILGAMEQKSFSFLLNSFCIFQIFYFTNFCLKALLLREENFLWRKKIISSIVWK